MWRQAKIASNYVVVCVTSDCPERFLNMCRHRNIFFWDVSKKEYGFDGKISRKDFLQLKEICYKTRSRVRIRLRRGIRFVLFKYRKHYSFLAGMCLSGLMLYACSLFAWDISFTGNSEYTDSFLAKYLSTIGVHAGMPLRDIDCSSIEHSLRSEYDNITWVSAQINGTRLIIHIKENDGAKGEPVNEEDERDIVASADGTVESIVTRKGTPLVKEGDTVKKGQVLVSGAVSIIDDAGTETEKIYTQADADIMIKTLLPYEDSLEASHEVKYYTGRKKRKLMIGLFGTDIEIGFSLQRYVNADVLTQNSVLRLTDSFFLPISLGSKDYLEYEMRTEEYEPEEAEEILYAKLNRYLKELLENKVQILDNSVKIDSNGIVYRLSGTLTASMPAFSYAPVADFDPVGDGHEKAGSG